MPGEYTPLNPHNSTAEYYRRAAAQHRIGEQDDAKSELHQYSEASAPPAYEIVKELQPGYAGWVASYPTVAKSAPYFDLYLSEALNYIQGIALALSAATPDSHDSHLVRGAAIFASIVFFAYQVLKSSKELSDTNFLLKNTLAQKTGDGAALQKYHTSTNQKVEKVLDLATAGIVINSAVMFATNNAWYGLGSLIAAVLLNFASAYKHQQRGVDFYKEVTGAREYNSGTSGADRKFTAACTLIIIGCLAGMARLYRDVVHDSSTSGNTVHPHMNSFMALAIAGFIAVAGILQVQFAQVGDSAMEDTIEWKLTNDENSFRKDEHTSKLDKGYLINRSELFGLQVSRPLAEQVTLIPMLAAVSAAAYMIAKGSYPTPTTLIIGTYVATACIQFAMKSRVHMNVDKTSQLAKGELVDQGYGVVSQLLTKIRCCC